MIWALLILGLYPYLIYPGVVFLISMLYHRPVIKRDVTPSVTVIISAFNEADYIVETVKNKLSQHYPADQLKVIVVSDGSDDGTDELVTRLAEGDERITFIRQEPRQGKTMALNTAVAICKSEIAVISDANSMYESDAVIKLVRSFADPTVGYVTGRMIYLSEFGTVTGEGCSAYMRYENHLREWESKIGSVVGVDGGIDAVRTKLYSPMASNQLPDFVLPLNVTESGYRVIYEPDAILKEPALDSIRNEFRMRIRVTTRALWAILDKSRLLNPAVGGLFSFQLISHKLMRYLSVLPLGAVLALSPFYVGNGIRYDLLASGELLFFGLSMLAMSERIAKSLPLTKYCLYFLLLNLSALVALARVATGRRPVLWQPRTS